MHSFKDFEASIDATIKSIEKHSLGIPRAEMPQVDEKDFKEFFEYLDNKGVKHKLTTMNADDLKATQKDFNPSGVKHMLTVEPSRLEKPLLVSNDNYLIDGHHRWTALRIMTKGKKIKVYRIDLPIRKALDVITKFPKTRYSTRKTEVAAAA